jgi:uncharacterized protein
MSEHDDDIERATGHRPWPLPDTPWIMVQSWQNQLFAHWRMRPDDIRPLVPSQLELDTFDGSVWIGVTPFLITGLRFRGLPELPLGSEFPELNVRTYVTVNGQPGVYFFSLDAGNRFAVIAARAGYGLPYHNAEMQITHGEDGWTEYASLREDGLAELAVRYRATSATKREATSGTLDHFLTERYVLYAVRGERVVRGDIQHRPWQLQPAEAEFLRNTVTDAAGIVLPREQPLLHYSARQDALIWPPAFVP